MSIRWQPRRRRWTPSPWPAVIFAGVASFIAIFAFVYFVLDRLPEWFS